MLDRRYALAALAATILLSGILLSPLSSDPQEALELEQTTTLPTGPIPAAIQAGAADPLAGLLSSSEESVRGNAVLSGLLSAVPPSPPTLTAPQLSEITAIAEGAVAGALSVSPDTLTSQADRTAFTAFARGYLEGSIAELPRTPSGARSAVDEALAQATFAGLASVLVSVEPSAPASAYREYAYTLAQRTFDELDRDAALFSQGTGSGAIADITLFATQLSRAQLSALPATATEAQLDAIASFGAGALTGLVAGVLAEDPQVGLPAPVDTYLRSWFTALGEGHVGTPPWDDPSNLALHAWADAIASTGVAGITSSVEELPGALAGASDELVALADGLAAAGYAALDGIQNGELPPVREDVAAYAEALVAPALAAIGEPHPDVDPDATRAWIEGLAAGVSDVPGIEGDGDQLLATYFGGLTTALTTFPEDMFPGNTGLLVAYGRGLTDDVTARMDAIAAAAVDEDDPSLLQAMALGLAESAVALAGGPALSDARLVEAIGVGYARGFLDSKDAQTLFDASEDLRGVTGSWFSESPPADIAALFFLGKEVAGGRYEVLQEYADAQGAAPRAWAANKGRHLTDEAEALTWLAEFQAAEAEAVLKTIMVDHGLTPEELNASVVAITEVYIPAVSGAIQKWNVTEITNSLNGTAVARHAVATANYVMTPLGWLGGPSSLAETKAALKVVEHTYENASTIQRFANNSYTSMAIAYVTAIADGIDVGGDDPTENLTNGSYLPAWVDGVLDAIEDVPVPQTIADIEGRRDWLVAATQAVDGGRVQNITTSQDDATRQLAYELGVWTLGARDRVPEGAFETPLLTWANASIRSALRSLPPVLTDQEIDATVAYLEGIGRAAEDLPPLDPRFWELQDLAAIEAYIGGIAGGVPLVVADTNAFLCASSKTRALGHDCPPPGHEEPEPCLIDCGEPEPEPEPDPGCDAFCELEAWSAKLLAWPHELSTAALLDVPSTTPTTSGILLVKMWAEGALAGEGFCAPSENEQYECDGPRGPGLAFAGASEQNVRTYARALGPGYAALVDAEDPAAHLLTTLGPATSPILGWSSGIQNAAMNYLLQPDGPANGGDGENGRDGEPAPPGTPGAPALPIGTPDADENDTDGDIIRWSEAVWDVVENWNGYHIPLPQTPFLDDTVVGISNLFAQEIWGGGYRAFLAANESTDGLTAIGRGFVPAGALDAWADGLGAAVVEDVNNTVHQDVGALLAWYGGLAEGGVEALATAVRQVNDSQIPAIQGYAEALAEAYTPPTPSQDAVLALLFPAPDPEENQTGGGSGGNGGGSTPNPNPQQVYLSALQTHAEGLAAAALAVPDPAQASWGTYIAALAAAAEDVPGVQSKDLATILSEWTQREAEGALATPPTTPDRLAPNAEGTLAFGHAYVKAFGASSPWNLPRDVDRQAVWARSAILAGASVACPSDLEAQACAALGATLGDALGRSLPREVEGKPIPSAAAQVAFVTSILEGVAPGASDMEPATAIATVLGLVGGLVPNYMDAPAETEAVTAAIADALAAEGDPLSPPNVEATAKAILESMPTPPTKEQIHQGVLDMRLKQRINDAVIRAVYAAEYAAGDPTAVPAAVKSFLAGDPVADPIVRVTDGKSTLDIGELDGTQALDGLVDLTFQLSPAGGNTPIHDQWRIFYQLGIAPPVERMMSQQPDGTWRTIVTPEDLAEGERGAKLSFYFQQYVAGEPTEARREGKDFSFIPDRDLPTVKLTAPGTASGASFPIAWEGTDGDTGIASYRVETKDNGGAWTTWIGETLDVDATFSGLAGHTYAFRVIATDVAGHASVASAETSVSVPAGAPPNRAPTVTIRAPANGAIFGASIPVEVSATDPDGTVPILRICLRKADSGVDLTCPSEGKTAVLTLDARQLADGRYRVHAIASDGTLTGEALSQPFGLDRAPPSFRGATVDATTSSTLLTAAVDSDATRVLADVGGRSLPLVDDGTGADVRAGDGTWTAQLALQPGEHAVTFRAADANGNEGSIERTVVVPAPPPPPVDPSEIPDTDTPATPPDGQVGTPPGEDEPPAEGEKKGTPLPSVAWLVLAALGIALLIGRRRS